MARSPGDPFRPRGLRRLVPAWARPAAHRGRIWGARLEGLIVRPRPDPVFVLGFHKSGTTAIAALLARHLGVRATLDMPALLDSLPAPRAWADFVNRYSAYFARPLVKEPWLTFAYSDLQALFPDGRFLLVVRDPRDNIRSVLDRMGLPGDERACPPGFWAVPRGWRELFPATVSRGEQHYIDALADRWNHAAQLAWSGQRPVPWVRYEDFVADKAGTIAALAETVGAQGKTDIAEAVDWGYQPMGPSRGMPWADFFGADNLARLERACQPGMAHFGYPPVSS